MVVVVGAGPVVLAVELGRLDETPEDVEPDVVSSETVMDADPVLP